MAYPGKHRPLSNRPARPLGPGLHCLREMPFPSMLLGSYTSPFFAEFLRFHIQKQSFLGYPIHACRSRKYSAKRPFGVHQHFQAEFLTAFFQMSLPIASPPAGASKPAKNRNCPPYPRCPPSGTNANHPAPAANFFINSLTLSNPNTDGG